MNDRYLHKTALCPACERDFLTTDVGAVYGLHPKNFDDVFVFGLCKNCSYIVGADKHDPQRLILRNRLEEYLGAASKDPFSRKVAVTSLKVLTIHNGDFADAIEIGWPYETPIDQCDVFVLPDGVLIVIEKESDHDA